MEKEIKIYEEDIFVESSNNLTEYRIWLNDLLDDEAIPYRTRIVEKNSGIPGIIFDSDYIIEFYVYENYYEKVMELINEYNKTPILEEQEELKISDDDLNY